MTTLNNLMSDATINLDYDSSIQILCDSSTAHYRMGKHGEILLGGEATGMSYEDLMKKEVTYISSVGDVSEIYVR